MAKRGTPGSVYRKFVTDNKGEMLTVNMTGRWDANRGMQHPVKKLRFQELWTSFDPEDFIHEPPPTETQRQLRDVFGDWVDAGRLKLAIHPYFRRWALWEKQFHSDGGGISWGVVSIFWEKPQEGVLPQDLQDSDHTYWNLRGKVGDFRLPNKTDFDLISRMADKHKYSDAQRIEALDAHSKLEEKRKLAHEEDASYDFHHYYFNAFRDAANREAGSGWKMSSYATVPHKMNDDRWHNEQVAILDAEGRQVGTYNYRERKKIGHHRQEAASTTETQQETPGELRERARRAAIATGVVG